MWSEVVEGEPAAALVEFAEHINAELIVIGDVGMGAGGRLRLSGVPDRISHSAPCSVLIVRTGNHGREANAVQRQPVRYRSVLIATDGSSTAAHAAHLGAALGRALGAIITLAHVGDESWAGSCWKTRQNAWESLIYHSRSQAAIAGKTIARLANEDGSDLVVVGNKGLAGASARARLGTEHGLAPCQMRRADSSHRRPLAR